MTVSATARPSRVGCSDKRFQRLLMTLLESGRQQTVAHLVCEKAQSHDVVLAGKHITRRSSQLRREKKTPRRGWFRQSALNVSRLPFATYIGLRRRQKPA